jgi:glyoxylase-like metal-dependent hydrolase (beta-lactamase superfamily II)
MVSQTQSFTVGEIQCHAISDGTFAYPTNWFFSNVPQPELEGSLRSRNLAIDQVVSPYTCLLVKTGKHTVLIDTGADGLAPTTGELLTKLRSENVAPEEITTVILTHGHPDHIGGALESEGKPAFPSARYVMAKTEWDFWSSDPDLGHTALDAHVQDLLINCARKNLPPLKERIDLIDVEKEVAPGIYATPAPGHTPGHLAVVVSSGDEQLLHIVDAVLHPMHLEHPSWRNVFDLDENDAVKTRRKLLDRAAADNAKVLAYHFPFPGLGLVKSRGNAWTWQPLEA